MKVALLNVRSDRKECINKDFMGGYGWAFSVGRSLPAKLIEFVKKKGELLPLMSYGYLAGIFAERGHDVSVVTNSVPDADVVFIQSSMVEHRAELAWADRVRRESTAKVGFIGPFSSYKPELFEDHCDFLIPGEPEAAAIMIAEGKPPQGRIESPSLQDLDSLPFPRWDFFDYREFSYIPALKEKPFFPILSSRGCPYPCSYCPYPVNFAYGSRSVENVLDEIRYLIEAYGARGMLFRDPTFTLDKKRAQAIAEGMIARGYDHLRWTCETRLDCLDEPLLEVLFRAGMRVINVAVESQDPEVLKQVKRKHIELEHQERLLAFCEKLGIRVTVFYIFGLPNDSRESIELSIRYAKALNSHVAQFFIFTPFPGTPQYEEVKHLICEEDWERFDCYTPVIRHETLSHEELLQLKEKAFVNYYYRPRWAVKSIYRLVRDFLH